MKTKSVRRAKPSWREGLSATSAGRFGGQEESLTPYNSGYLTACATATRVYVHCGDYGREFGRNHLLDTVEDLGNYQLPRDFRQKTKTTWVSNQYVFSHADGSPHSTVTRSLLFPGFHHEIRTGLFEYYFRIRGYGPSVMALPLKGGLKQITATDGYDAKRMGRLAKPWILLYWCDSGMPFDYPMQIAFNRAPVSIEFIAHEYLKIRFAKNDAAVVQIHPFGAERFDKAVTREWKKGLPEGVEQKLDLLARAALAYPYECRESFLIDEARGTVRIRNEFKHLVSKSEWGIRPLVLAPLPPLVANLRNVGYPVKVKGEVIERICPAFSGWYEAVEGRTLEYELPLSRFRNLTLAPVRIKNNPLADEVERKLTEYLESGRYLTFGGDDDYDPECPLDSLHDLRIMAWATRSIAPEKRAKAMANLTRGLKNFDDNAYLHYEVKGVPWARDKTIFANWGLVDYDFEWYNGMNLAGLWAYAYYAGGKEPRRLIRERWPLIEKVFSYAKCFSDWAQLACWTCCRGEATWLDGINYTYQGVLGYAALARDAGRRAEAEWGDYIAARLEAFVCNSWLAGGYYAKHFPLGAGDNPLCAGGYWEGRPTGYAEGDDWGWSCGIYGYCVPEVLVLLRDLKREGGIRRSLEEFGRRHPDWRRDPYSYGKAKGYPGFDERRTIHHYFLDPRLMVSALVLGEDVRGILGLGAPLTGPVLECCLVALAPRLLVARDVEFIDSVWDDAAKTLTVKLSGKGQTTLAFAHSGRPKVVAGRAALKSADDARATFECRLDGVIELAFQWDR